MQSRGCRKRTQWLGTGTICGKPLRTTYGCSLQMCLPQMILARGAHLWCRSGSMLIWALQRLKAASTRSTKMATRHPSPLSQQHLALLIRLHPPNISFFNVALPHCSFLLLLPAWALTSTLQVLENRVKWLQDPNGSPHGPEQPRRRVVMLVTFPPGCGFEAVQQVSLCKHGNMLQSCPICVPEAAAPEDGDDAVYEWWYGDRNPEAELKGVKPRGYWRTYHPKVCCRPTQNQQLPIQLRAQLHISF